MIQGVRSPEEYAACLFFLNGHLSNQHAWIRLGRLEYASSLCPKSWRRFLAMYRCRKPNKPIACAIRASIKLCMDVVIYSKNDRIN
jgi:hypothetical protein